MAVRYGTTNQNTLKMAKKKKYTYLVTVESYGEQGTYQVKADSFNEAKVKAKKLFMKEYWNPSKLKYHNEYREINF